MSENGKTFDPVNRLTNAFVREAKQLEIQQLPDYEAVNNGKRIDPGWGVQSENDRLKVEPEQQRAVDKLPAERKREGGWSKDEGAWRFAPLDEDRIVKSLDPSSTKDLG